MFSIGQKVKILLKQNHFRTVPCADMFWRFTCSLT